MRGADEGSGRLFSHVDLESRTIREIANSALATRVRLAFAAACPEADLFRSRPAALMPAGP